MTKASIHYHFEKKKDLGAAILERMMERLEQLLLRIASLPPEERLEHYFSDRLSRFGMQDICPLSSLQADFESLPEALQHKVKEVSEKELFILIQILKAIQEEGGIDSAAEIEPLAIMILAGGKGILQYQRVFGRKGNYPLFFSNKSIALFNTRP
ncbi:TetR/AcrR family transcriptional regulator [Cohnella luojiensis]|uniref:TetR/AcrR family transcriptional regulator n=1 Tax=Cohnella luojiensis TaxID=652876 RepID=A0A4Y8LXK7_9BACL|nr:TetR/AcrR family transcriptional regulator [Cohnella luojiensis]TFE26703.1 TetR/AcrR family transcriptional regulator [Cohnella luojiensis]